MDFSRDIFDVIIAESGLAVSCRLAFEINEFMTFVSQFLYDAPLFCPVTLYDKHRNNDRIKNINLPIRNKLRLF